MIPECDSCGQEMTLVKRFNNLVNRQGNQYRVRRFHCDLCDIYFTMYADGHGDKEHEHEAVESAKKLK